MKCNNTFWSYLEICLLKLLFYVWLFSIVIQIDNIISFVFCLYIYYTRSSELPVVIVPVPFFQYYVQGEWNQSSIDGALPGVIVDKGLGSCIAKSDQL